MSSSFTPMLGAATVYFINDPDDAFTGWVSDADLMTKLKRSIAAMAKVDAVKTLYIGITSGEEWTGAFTSRHDAVKKANGVNCMRMVYSSSSLKHTKYAERKLIEFFQEDSNTDVIVDNKVDGGGGREGTGPNYYVYVALRYWPKIDAVKNRTRDKKTMFIGEWNATQEKWEYKW